MQKTLKGLKGRSIGVGKTKAKTAPRTGRKTTPGQALSAVKASPPYKGRKRARKSVPGQKLSRSLKIPHA